MASEPRKPPIIDFPINVFPTLKPGMKIWWRRKNQPGPILVSYVAEVREKLIRIADDPWPSWSFTNAGTWINRAEIEILDEEEARP